MLHMQLRNNVHLKSYFIAAKIDYILCTHFVSILKLAPFQKLFKVRTFAKTFEVGDVQAVSYKTGSI